MIYKIIIFAAAEFLKPPIYHSPDVTSIITLLFLPHFPLRQFPDVEYNKGKKLVIISPLEIVGTKTQ